MVVFTETRENVGGGGGFGELGRVGEFGPGARGGPDRVEVLLDGVEVWDLMGETR